MSRCTRRPLRIEPLEDRVTPVVVSSLNPSLAGGTLPAAATNIQVNYSAAVIGGATASNFELRGIGADGLLGTADDVLVSLGASYAGNTTTLTFTTLPSNSVANVWRLTVKSTITDTSGVALDGDGDGNPGGNFVRDFVSVPVPVVSLTSSGGFAFDSVGGGFGAGQLLQGDSDAFDGLNRLQVGGVDFAPTQPSTAAVVVQEVVSTTTASISQTSFSDIPGLNTTVAATGLYRVSATLNIQNFGSGSALVSVRLTVNGLSVEERMITFEPNTDTAQHALDLEDYLSLNAGDNVRLSATGFNSAGAPTFNSGAAPQYLRLLKYNDIPLVGPGVTVQEITSNTVAALNTSNYADVPGLTATVAASGTYRLSSSVNVQNFSTAASIVPVRFLINGTGGENRIISFGPGSNTFTESIHLEDHLNLNAGDVVKVQAYVNNGTAAFNGGSPSTAAVLRLLRFNDVPNAGGSIAVQEVGSDTNASLSNSAFTDVPLLTSTVPETGLYRVSTSLTLQNFAVSAATMVYARFSVNGVAQAGASPITFGPSTNTGSASLQLDRYLSLNAGDVVKVQAQVFSPGVASFNGQSGTQHFLRLARFIPHPNPAVVNRTVVTPAQTIGGLVVSREITVPSTGSQDFARTIEVITNPTAGTITTPVRVTGNLGSNATVFATQNGNLAPEPMDQWIGTDDGDGTGSPAVVHIIRGPAGLRPSAVSTSGDNITWTFNVTVAPGATVRLASFTVLGTTRAAAVAAARAINTPSGLAAEADAFLSQAQLDLIANFDAPAVAPSDTLVIGGGSQAASVGAPNAAGQYGSLTGATGGLSGVVRTASADVNGDEVPDAILVTGPGQPIRVAVVSGLDNSTVLVAPFDPFGGDFLGGGFVSTADLDGDGRAEFLVTPDRGGGPRVSIYSLNANSTVSTRANFFGIDDPNFRGGARAAVGDIDADGVPELLVAAGFGGGPRVAVFRGATLFSTRGRLVSDFFAFPEDANTLRNGVFATLGDINGDGFADLVFGGGPGGGPRVYILSGQFLVSNNANLFSQPIANFFVSGNGADRGGVRLAVKNADGDARADLIAGSGEGSPSNVRIYLGKTFTGTGEPGGFQDLSVFGGAILADGVFVG